MKKRVIAFALMLLATPLMYAFTEKRLFLGTIQFPQHVNRIEPIRIYNSGIKISSDIDQDNKTLSFSIPEHKQRTFFIIVVTNSLFIDAEANTVEHGLHAPGRYKAYAVELIDGAWNIKEIRLAQGFIPDEAIIVYYDPELIDHLEGGTLVELPRIVIKKEIVEIVGSQEKINDLFTYYSLTALNADALHDNPHQEVKIDCPGNKTILTLNYSNIQG